MRRIKEVLRLKYELGLGQRQIARSCSVSVATLERLNNLHGKAIKPGQVLKLDAP